MRAEILASRPADWGRQRTTGQLLCAGRHNPGQPENLLSTVPHLAPHAGRWANDTTLTSTRLLDGTNARLQLATHPSGIDVAEFTYQFVDNDTYRWAEASTFGSSVASPPSDPLLWDAPRNELSLGEHLTTVGPTSRPLRVGAVFVVPEWAPADDNTTFLWELHDPTGRKTSPILCSLRAGTLYVGGKHDPRPVADTPGNITNGWSAKVMDLPPPGTIVGLVFDLKVDPTGSGYLRVLDAPTGAVLLDHDHRFGWFFDDPKLNGEFFPQCFKTYQFMRWGVGGDWLVTGRPNFDVRFGPIRRTQHVGFFLADDVEVSEMVDWCRALMPNGWGPILERLGVLEAEMAVVKARLDRVGTAWSIPLPPV